MSVIKEVDGRRSIQVEVIVPGTQDEVWQAIASGPGISSWFVPTEVETADGKPVAMRCTFGPGMTVSTPLTSWQPPHRFAAEGEGWGGSPPVATEWTVEPRADRCLVRVENSLRDDSDTWDQHLEMVAKGWPAFFRTLKLYLMHFRGQPSALMQFVVPVAGTEPQVWDALLAAIGLTDASLGQHWRAPAGVPALAGVIEYFTKEPNDALLRMDTPGPGVAALGTFGYGEQSMAALNFYHYGDNAAATVASETPQWHAWIAQHFAAQAR